MYNFEKAFQLLNKGHKIRKSYWPETYHIFLENECIFDSMGNLYVFDRLIYETSHKTTENAAGKIWELYHEITDSNL